MVQKTILEHYSHNKKNSNTLFYLFILLFQQIYKENSCIRQRCSYLLFCIIMSLPTQAQMLFSENLTMSIDSTKSIQGSLQPVLDFKTEKENVLTLKNTAHLNL